MASSADTRPISPTRFSAALKDLSISMLHLKVLEIRNSIAHLQYSNDQLKPFADGSATAVSDSTPGEPDQDCIDAIRENDQVIDRMAERIALIKIEVEERGVSWTEFQSKEEVEAKAEEKAKVNGETTNGQGAAEDEMSERSHPAWSDGTFQMGTIRNGEVHMDNQAGQPEGGSLSDEQLRRALEERMRDLGTDDDDGGMHL
ncbi:Fc.00g066210.m01.CDS01 [Cosmosporella sp. VM-42]